MNFFSKMGFFLYFLNTPVGNIQNYFSCVNLENFTLNEICQLNFKDSIINFYISDKFEPRKSKMVFEIDEGKIKIVEKNPKFKNKLDCSRYSGKQFYDCFERRVQIFEPDDSGSDDSEFSDEEEEISYRHLFSNLKIKNEDYQSYSKMIQRLLNMKSVDLRTDFEIYFNLDDFGKEVTDFFADFFVMIGEPLKFMEMNRAFSREICLSCEKFLLKGIYYPVNNIDRLFNALYQNFEEGGIYMEIEAFLIAAYYADENLSEKNIGKLLRMRGECYEANFYESFYGGSFAAEIKPKICGPAAVYILKQLIQKAKTGEQVNENDVLMICDNERLPKDLRRTLYFLTLSGKTLEGRLKYESENPIATKKEILGEYNKKK